MTAEAGVPVIAALGPDGGYENPDYNRRDRREIEAEELKAAEPIYPGVTEAWKTRVASEYNTEYESEALRAVDEFEFSVRYKAACPECETGEVLDTHRRPALVRQASARRGRQTPHVHRAAGLHLLRHVGVAAAGLHLAVPVDVSRGRGRHPPVRRRPRAGGRVNAEQWNAAYPVGTPVLAYPGARPEDEHAGWACEGHRLRPPHQGPGNPP